MSSYAGLCWRWGDAIHHRPDWVLFPHAQCSWSGSRRAGCEVGHTCIRVRVNKTATNQGHEPQILVRIIDNAVWVSPGDNQRLHVVTNVTEYFTNYHSVSPTAEVLQEPPYEICPP